MRAPASKDGLRVRGAVQPPALNAGNEEAPVAALDPIGGRKRAPSSHPREAFAGTPARWQASRRVRATSHWNGRSRLEDRALRCSTRSRRCAARPSRCAPASFRRRRTPSHHHPTPSFAARYSDLRNFVANDLQTADVGARAPSAARPIIGLRGALRNDRPPCGPARLSIRRTP